jgi:hypothetical protein
VVEQMFFQVEDVNGFKGTRLAKVHFAVAFDAVVVNGRYFG